MDEDFNSYCIIVLLFALSGRVS